MSDPPLVTLRAPQVPSLHERRVELRGDGMISTMRSRPRAAMLTVLAAAFLAPGPSWAQTGALSDEVGRAIATRKLGTARVGVSIIDMDSGAALAAVHATDPFTPASNMKLLTSGAALLVL